MKLINSLAIIGATTSSRIARQDDDRRYSQLTDMMEHYNADFDERKYWAYGCNCLILGKPQSESRIDSTNQNKVLQMI